VLNVVLPQATPGILTGTIPGDQPRRRRGWRPIPVHRPPASYYLPHLALGNPTTSFMHLGLSRVRARDAVPGRRRRQGPSSTRRFLVLLAVTFVLKPVRRSWCARGMAAPLSRERRHDRRGRLPTKRAARRLTVKELSVFYGAKKALGPRVDGDRRESRVNPR